MRGNDGRKDGRNKTLDLCHTALEEIFRSQQHCPIFEEEWNRNRQLIRESGQQVPLR
jgi:hypothetical protein